MKTHSEEIEAHRCYTSYLSVTVDELCAQVYLHSFTVLASQICEITRNSEKIRTYSIDLGNNRMRICNFILVINSNFGPILHRF